MFVYLLPSNDGSRFKIGKANDVYQRVLGLGGSQGFQMDKGLYIKLKTEQDARRVERILHRTFRSFNLPVNPQARYEGDTEQFDISCFDRVVRFLIENKDLLETDDPIRIPELVQVASAPVVSKEERRERIRYQRKATLISELAGIKARNASSLKTLTQLVDDLRTGAFKGGRLQHGSLLVLTGLPREQLSELSGISLITLGGASNPFPSVRQTEDVALVEVMDDYLSHYGSEQPWLSRRAGENVQIIYDGQKEIAHDAQEIRRVFAEIPLLSERDVLQLIVSSSDLGTVEADSLPAIQSGIRRTVLGHYKSSHRMFSASLGDKTGLEYWELKFWQSNLRELGFSDRETSAQIEEEYAFAQKEFANLILALAKEVFGETTQDWLHEPDRCLEGETPISLFNSEKGLKRLWYALTLYAEQ
ncbi:GIY-YIG nuclease family protein [Herbaspirillum seropedicae]|uniref:GIY-YIG nuclease family protein n=1 Tax=Herbaspirillum seropedicae TaxID=964 RepID=UPI0008481329|nr:GIY-YIG nuclease family protein [Herbaspirillum seropedicae]AON53808.1 hypothetical protein Hsc_1505 [Herbaspirillum seropedicae]